MQKNRQEAQAIMQELGYEPDNPLPVKISTRNTVVYRDPAAILIDQLKEISIDGELESVETANWVPKVIRKDFRIGLNVLGTAVDDPDIYFTKITSAAQRAITSATAKGIRQDDRPAVDRGRSGDAQTDRAGRRL